MNLKTQYGSKYRVTLDESFKQEKDTESRKLEWSYHEIRGRYGMVFLYAQDKPAVTFTSNIVANRFSHKSQNDWKILQNGEDEQTWLIPKSDVDEVLEAIKPRRKRQVTEEMREKGRKLAETHGFHKKPDVTESAKYGVKGT